MLLFNHLPRLEGLDTEFIDFVILTLCLRKYCPCAMTSAMLVTCYHVYFWSNSLTHRLVCRTTCSEEFPRKPQAPTSSFHTSKPHCKPTYVGPSSLADDYLVKDKQVLNNSMKYIKYRLGPLQIIIHGIKRVKMIGTPNILCITLGNRDPKTRTELF